MRFSIEFRPGIGVEPCGCVSARDKLRRNSLMVVLVKCEGHDDPRVAAERAFEAYRRDRRVEKVLWLREHLRKKREESS